MYVQYSDGEDSMIIHLSGRWHTGWHDCRQGPIMHTHGTELKQGPLTQHSDMLTAQAVCCALLYSADSHGDEDTIDDYMSQVQSHLQTVGQTDMAQDIAYSLKLAKHIHKASC